MGNSESSSSCGSPRLPLSLPLGRCNSSGSKSRPQSQSPAMQSRSNSVRRNQAPTPAGSMSSEPLRRSRTCRVRDRSIRRAVCSITGLTIHQKALLARKWNRMDRGTIYEIGRRMFESIFAENPQYLAYIELRDVPNWNNHINFKIHVQRFVNALIDSMRRLKEPALAVDILRDFGASYARAANVKRVSALYFEKLANALNQTAAQLQESDHLELEKSRIEDPSDSSLSSDGDRVVADSLSGTSTACSSLPSLSSAQRSSRVFLSRHSETQMQVLSENASNASSFSRRCSSNCQHNGKSICPITAEAWIVLSAFLANQIKFGYEMEKLLQTEMAKLGLLERLATGAETCRHAHFSQEPPTQFV